MGCGHSFIGYVKKPEMAFFALSLSSLIAGDVIQ